MKTHILKILVFIIFIIFYSCEDFIDIDPPTTQISGQDVFKELATAEAAMNEVYVRLREKSILSGNSHGATYALGVYTDELKNYNASFSWEEELYRNNLISTNVSIQNIWNDSYNIIYLCNRIIEGLENSSFIVETEKDKLIGEAIFVRTLTYYYLTHLFGDIPYTTTTSYEVNRQLSKIPNNEIRQQLIEDLIIADEKLKNYTDTYLQNRPNKWAVQTLISRLFLEDENWAQAIEYASNVMNAGYELEQREKVFLKESRSTIWHLKSAAEGVNTKEATSLMFSSLPPPKVGLAHDLVNSFEENDLRKELWVKELNDESGEYFHAYKYKENQNTASSIEYSVIFRIEEIVYILIESELNIGNYESAINLWNDLRVNNNLEAWITLPNNPLDSLIEDRRKEFFCEHGHRFIDLKRTNKLLEVMSMTKQTWNVNNKNWPIPQSEILLNPNLLPQNDGY